MPPDPRVLAVARGAHLCLARAGGHAIGLTVGLSTGGRGTGAVVQLVAGKQIVRVRQRCLAHATHRLARSRLLAILAVGSKVEGDEENKVGAENANTSKGGKLLTRAVTKVGELREVGGGEVGVRGEVDKACILVSSRTLLPGARNQEPCNVPRSMMNWIIWNLVTHSFHHMRIPRADWK